MFDLLKARDNTVFIPSHPKNIKYVLVRDLPEDRVFFRVFYRNLIGIINFSQRC